MGRCGGYVCKCFLSCLSIIYKLEGAAIGGFGAWLKKNKDSFNEKVISPELFDLVVWILIVQGAWMAALGALGLYALWKEKKSELKTVCIFMSILAFADVVIGLILYFKCNEFGKYIAEQYISAYEELKGNGNHPNSFPPIHFTESLECCGIPKDQSLCEGEPSVLQDCPGVITYVFSIIAQVSTGIFLGTAGILIITATGIAVFLKQNQRASQEHTAHFSAGY